MDPLLKTKGVRRDLKCVICVSPFVASAQGRYCDSCKEKIKSVQRDLMKSAYGDAVEVVTREAATKLKNASLRP